MLYIKEYPDGRELHKVVTERAFGMRLDKVNELSDDIVEQLFHDIEELITYLFSVNVSMKDIEDENIFITPERRLKIAYFYGWQKESCNSVLAYNLLVNTFTLKGMVFEKSKQFSDELCEKEACNIAKELEFNNIGRINCLESQRIL